MRCDLGLLWGKWNVDRELRYGEDSKVETELPTEDGEAGNTRLINNHCASLSVALDSSGLFVWNWNYGAWNY